MSIDEALTSIEDGTDYLSQHRRRFAESHRFLEPVLASLASPKVLDLGSYGHFANLLKAMYPGMDVQVSEYFDLRHPFPLPDSSFDVICFMEVLEHIKDRDSTEHYNISGFVYDGIDNVMSEIHRILKPGGVLFLTTPNISSWMAILRALSYHSPVAYLHHVKEFSVNEIRALCAKHNFRVAKLDTPEWVYSRPNKHDVDQLKEFATDHGYDKYLRGDSIFLVATRRNG